MFTDNEFDMSNQLSAILETKIDVGENTTEPEACKIIFIPGHWEEEVHYKSACIKYKCDRFGYLTSGTSLGSGKRNSRDCCYGTVSGGTCDGDAYTIQWKCQAHPPYVIAFCRDGDRQVGAYRKEVGCSMGSNAGEWGCVKESCAAVGYIGVINKNICRPTLFKDWMTIKNLRQRTFIR